MRGPIQAYDEYSDREIELHIGQKDPNSIKGLLIDFRYVTRDREVSRRSVLCWQCGRDGDRLYVRGYCAFREELRTFRIDRMSDVIAIQGEHELPVDDINAFFAAFAARETHARRNLRIGAPD
jgi:predicted DNA-binding transcriptional regulator YafY